MSNTKLRKRPRLEVQTESEMAENSAPSGMQSRLNTDQMTSLSFLEAPHEIVSEVCWNGYFSEDLKTYGVQCEAFKRDAYEHLSNYLINEKWVDSLCVSKGFDSESGEKFDSILVILGIPPPETVFAHIAGINNGKKSRVVPLRNGPCQKVENAFTFGCIGCAKAWMKKF